MFNESRVALSLTESRVVQKVQKESDVGLYAGYLHLLESSYRLAACAVESPVMRADLNEQRVVIRCDDRSGKTVSAVESDAVS